LAGLSTGIINVLDYARIIYDLAIRRKLIDIGTDMVNDAYKDDSEAQAASDQIEKVEHQLFGLASEGLSERSFQHLKQSLAEAITRAEFALKNQGGISGVPTGLIDLDRLLGGLHNSDLVIIAARPSMGKTALAINVALNAAEAFMREHKKKHETEPDFVEKEKNLPASVGFFSLEMSAEQIASRLLSMKSGINSNNIRRGRFDKEKREFHKLVEANQELYQLPFFIDETPAISISALRTRARRLKRKHNLGVLIVDYLQLIRGISETSKNNRVQEVSEITQGLKAIAKELDIPVVALSQLSRQVESRDDKRPQLSDLRESGSIEQDADVVLFVYREEYYLQNKEPRPGTPEFAQWTLDMENVHGKAEIIIGKQRHGPTGTVPLQFEAMVTRFADLEDESRMPAQVR
jgi:replicative DNA helicase